MGSRPLTGRGARGMQAAGGLAVRTAVLGAACLLAGAACAPEEPHSAADIERAVEAYLAERTDLRTDLMRIRADRIRYEGERAVAEVSIIASDDPQAAMQMVYVLERSSAGWRVVPEEPLAGGRGGAAPPGHGAAPGLPPGHPPTGPPADGLPPGHPPLGGQPDR